MAQSYHYSGMSEAYYCSQYLELSVVGKLHCRDPSIQIPLSLHHISTHTLIALSPSDLKTPCHRGVRRFNVSCDLRITGNKSFVTTAPHRVTKSISVYQGSKTRDHSFNMCPLFVWVPQHIYITGPEVFALYGRHIKAVIHWINHLPALLVYSF